MRFAMLPLNRAEARKLSCPLARSPHVFLCLFRHYFIKAIFYRFGIGSALFITFVDVSDAGSGADSARFSDFAAEYGTFFARALVRPGRGCS